MLELSDERFARRVKVCRSNLLGVAGVAGKRIAFDITNTRSQGAGVMLAGRPVLPHGNGHVPIVVLVHDSEHGSAPRYYDLQRMFPPWASATRAGGSEGGWVAPLAANISLVDFVIVGFGLAVSPLDEDREAITYDMNHHGFGPDVMAKAMRVADTSAAILPSDFRTGYAQLDALKQKYGKEPWFKYVCGDVTWILPSWPAAKLK